MLFNNLKFTLKHLKRSYMFRSHHHSLMLYGTQSTSITRLILNSVRLTHNIRHAATAPTYYNDVIHWVF